MLRWQGLFRPKGESSMSQELPGATPNTELPTHDQDWPRTRRAMFQVDLPGAKGAEVVFASFAACIEREANSLRMRSAVQTTNAAPQPSRGLKPGEVSDNSLKPAAAAPSRTEGTVGQSLIAELEALESRATPAPWEADGAVDTDGKVTRAIYHRPKPHHIVEVVESPDAGGDDECIHSDGDHLFIVALRNAWPQIKEALRTRSASGAMEALRQIAVGIPRKEDSIHGPRLRCRQCSHAWGLDEAEHHGDDCAYVAAIHALNAATGSTTTNATPLAAFCPVTPEGCTEDPVCVWPCKKLKDRADVSTGGSHGR